MWQKISQIILRNRLIIFISLMVFTIIFLFFAITNIDLDNKYGNILPSDSQPQKDYKKFKSIFGEDGGSLILALEQDDFYTVKNISNWKELSDTISTIPGVLSVISEIDLVRLVKQEKNKTFAFEKIIDTINSKKLSKAKEEIRSLPFYQDILFSKKNNSVTLMLIEIDEKFLENKEKANIVVDIENIVKEKTKNMGKVHYAGLPHIRVIIGKRIINEMYVFIFAAIVITALLLWIFFRSFKVVLKCLFVVAIAVIWSLGLIGLLGFKLSILMALIPPLMIVIGIPNCIFILNKYHQEIKIHNNKAKALTRVITKIGSAIFLTNLTTSLGFSTFIFTNSEKLIQFGIVASGSILFIFVLSISLIPIISSYLKNPKEKHLKHLDKKFSKKLVECFVTITKYHKKWVYIITTLVLIISIYGITKMNATGNLTGDLPKSDDIYKDIKFIENTFNGAIPFEIMIEYKKPSKLLKSNTLKKIEKIQNIINSDSNFGKSVSIIDFIKTLNFSFYYNENKSYESNIKNYRLIKNRDKRIFKPYIKNLFKNSKNQNNLFQFNRIVDTSKCVLRISTTMKDYGSYKVDEIVKNLKFKMDSVLNPNKNYLDSQKTIINTTPKKKLDSILSVFYKKNLSIYNNLINKLSEGKPELQYEFDSNPNKIFEFHHTTNFKQLINQAIDEHLFDLTITGTSVVVSQGTKYLVKNLLLSLCIAIVIISILMAILFRSLKMVAVSLIPNFIPLITTAAIMGFFGIAIKPSTVLIFSIAFGISVDDTIHFLAKYRQELKNKALTTKECIINALRETGLSMFYTSIVLFFGFNMFSFSQFGGTKSLGILVSLTLLVAMITNLILLPSLLMTLNKKSTFKNFEEPYFEIYDEEEDIELGELEIKENTKD